ncbi:MAG TPA: glycosyltransferase family 39 protein [Planktothrix sp.]|jgi:hypothetical protein
MNRLLSRPMALKFLNGATVLLLALVVRVLYCLVLAPRQLCGLNDQPNFEMAAAIGTAMSHSSGAVDFARALTGEFVGTSTALDALVRQGPLYPLYLSSLVRWFGLPPGFHPAQTNCIGFVAANIVLSSLSCVFIYYAARIAFSRRTALFAALLSILYAPSVLNAMHCYPEILCNFLVSGWLALLCLVLLRHEKRSKLPALFVIGVLSGLIVLCTPALLMMPAAMALALVLYKLGEPLKRHFASTSRSEESATVAQPVSATSEQVGDAVGDTVAGTVGETVAEPILETVGDTGVEDVGETVAQPPPETVGDTVAKTVAEPGKLLDFSAGPFPSETQDFAPQDPEIEPEVKPPAAVGPEETNADTAAAQIWRPIDERQPERAPSTDERTETSTIAAASSVLPDQSAVAATPQPLTPEYKPVDTRKLTTAMLVALAGVIVALAPWLWLQHAGNNTLDLFSEPSASSRLWLGNMLNADGWRLLPGAEFPFSSVRVVARNLLMNTLAAPVPFVALILQKFARLWCGGWNDYQSDAYGLNLCGQNVLHSLLLLSAYIGFCFILLNHMRWRFSRAIPCAVAMCIILISHCWYCFFDPLSRNNFTAMPAIIILSAYCLQHLLTQPRKQKLQSLIVVVVATALFAWLQSGGTTVPTMMQVFASDFWARTLDVLIIILVWAFLAWLILPIVQDISGARVSIASDMVKLGCFGVILVIVACGMADDRWRQWKTDMKNHREQVEQKIWIPQTSSVLELADPARRSSGAFVLVDLGSPIMLPPVSVSVNDVIATEPPIPWLALKPMDFESQRIIQTQADGMGTDWRAFRQWWAIPISASTLKFGEPNKIDVSFLEDQGVITYQVYGEYGKGKLTRNDSYKIMPSLSTLSWQKGFGSYEDGDMRLSETLVLQGKVTESSFSTDTKAQYNDLSFDSGRQCGQFRIRLAMPENNNITSLTFAPIEKATEAVPPSADSDTTNEVFFHPDAMGVAETDPKTEIITPNLIDVPSAKPGMRYLFSCDTQSMSGNGCGTIKVEFSGQKPSGELVQWTSPFAPHIIPLTPKWHLFSFCDFIPDDVAELSNLKVSITATAQDPASKLLHPEAAKNQAMVLKRVSLKILPPLNIPNDKDRDWMLF